MPTFAVPDKPEPLAAVGLALAVLRKARSDTWAGLVEDGIPEKIEISDEQYALIERNFAPVSQIVVGKAIPAWCSTCGEWFLTASSRSVPSSCRMTWGCPGKPEKASAAKLDKGDS